METPIAQPTRQGSPVLNFLVGLVCVAMTIAFGIIAAQSLGYIGQVASPIPLPTPIIRVVAPAPPAAPAEQPVRPAVVAPDVQQPVVAPAPVEQQPTPVQRQIIIIKQADNPAAAPIVIDRGTKRRSP